MRSSVDQELSAKIDSELQMEKDIRDSEQYPSRVQEYLDTSPFKVRQNGASKFENTKYHSFTIHLDKKKLS